MKNLNIGLAIFSGIIYLITLGYWIFAEPTQDNIFFLVGLIAVVVTHREMARRIEDVNEDK